VKHDRFSPPSRSRSKGAAARLKSASVDRDQSVDKHQLRKSFGDDQRSPHKPMFKSNHRSEDDLRIYNDFCENCNIRGRVVAKIRGMMQNMARSDLKQLLSEKEVYNVSSAKNPAGMAINRIRMIERESGRPKEMRDRNLDSVGKKSRRRSDSRSRSCRRRNGKIVDPQHKKRCRITERNDAAYSDAQTEAVESMVIHRGDPVTTPDEASVTITRLTDHARASTNAGAASSSTVENIIELKPIANGIVNENPDARKSGASASPVKQDDGSTKETRSANSRAAAAAAAKESRRIESQREFADLQRQLEVLQQDGEQQVRQMKDLQEQMDKLQGQKDDVLKRIRNVLLSIEHSVAETEPSAIRCLH